VVPLLMDVRSGAAARIADSIRSRHDGRLANIGLGGMDVCRDRRQPPRSPARACRHLELRFDGALAAWQRVSGRIRRIEARGAAITFAAPTAPALLLVIDGLTTASHASARVISVVLIDADAARRAAIAAGFRTAGCQVVEVASQLEAIVRLGESHFEPDIIAVASARAARSRRHRELAIGGHRDSGPAGAHSRAPVLGKHANGSVVDRDIPRLRAIDRDARRREELGATVLARLGVRLYSSLLVAELWS
jgi:hypothetical protein